VAVCLFFPVVWLEEADWMECPQGHQVHLCVRLLHLTCFVSEEEKNVSSIMASNQASKQKKKKKQAQSQTQSLLGHVHFSRAWQQLRQLASSSHWLINSFTFYVIGH